MCHGKMRRSEGRSERERGEGLWDLFHRETERPAPPAPVVERDEPAEPEREEILTAAAPRRGD